jgi:streptogramin lyase
MNLATTSRASLRSLVLALVGTMVALVAPTADAAPERAVGSFETSKPAKLAGTAPRGIAAGPDGAMWFAEQGTSRISKVGTGKGRLVTTSIK